jgi:hypothetical protein
MRFDDLIPMDGGDDSVGFPQETSPDRTVVFITNKQAAIVEIVCARGVDPLE